MKISLNELFIVIFCIVLVIQMYVCNEKICDRRPLGTKTDPLPPDNRFKIDIIGIYKDMYIPNNVYSVRLSSTDGISTFIAFTISAREDTKTNEKNRRKPILLDPGMVYPSPDSDTVSSPICNNSVIQTDITAKTSVEAFWRAPPKDNKCVTIYAVLAVKPNVWYNFDGPLSKKVCEDRRNKDDMPPMENDNCLVCEDARYLLNFEGLWSYNTHPYMFPESFPEARQLARFSDVVGASHSNNFYVFKSNSEATEGLKMLAEQGNTTRLEIEILSQLGTNVRSLIKASGRPKPNMVTSSEFRVTSEHHLISLVTAIIPSPDWFLGVANMELCEVGTNRWTPNLTLNLYPLDAGTDSGASIGSPNEDTMPPQAVSSLNLTIPKEQIKPFARLRFQLIRTYITPRCSTENPDIENNQENEDNNKFELNEITQDTTPPYEKPSTDPDSSSECPMTTWEEWLPCEGECVDSRLKGFRTRLRYHLVDGIAYEKYVENGPSYEDKEVSQYCLDNYPVNEIEQCEEDCEEEQQEGGEEETDSRTW